jgi:O-acetyl-ADP-ribose deacetylase (regulator of RNase III)
MIKFIKGDLFTSEAEALVNAVNTVGIMGGGIALTFKNKFPENFTAYAEACKHGGVILGKMFVTRNNSNYIINFPTKDHWRDPSKIEWIESGLEDLIKVITENRIKSIAIPALGCGLGGLGWGDVKPKITKALEGLPIEALLYEPQ